MEVLDILELVEDESEVALPKRLLADVFNPLERYNEKEFKQRFRFSKDVFKLLYGIIKDDVELDCRAHALPPVLQLAITLRFYATGHFQRTDGDLLRIGRRTTQRSVHSISRAICRKRSLFVYFTRNLSKIKTKFYEISGFPDVVGAIDCTHIPIISPGKDSPEIFRNRKGYFSLNVQMVCDSNRIVTDVVARWPGSTHDSRIFENCSLRDALAEKRLSGLLLGDNGYACKPYLMTPLLDPTSSAEKKYNEAHKATRSRIEQCFGLMKQRFRALRIPLRTRLDNSMAIIVSITCLHNLAVKTRQEESEDDIQIDESRDIIPPSAVGSSTGHALRRSIIQRYFSA